MKFNKISNSFNGITLLFLIFIFPFFLTAQNISLVRTPVDSLENLLNSSQWNNIADSLKADALRRLSIYYVRKSSLKTIDFAKQYLKFAKKINDVTDEAIALNLIGIGYNSIGDYNKTLEYYNSSLKCRQKLNNRKMISNSLNNIGTTYIKLGDLDKGLEYYEKALSIRYELDDQYGVSQTLNNIGVLYKMQEQYDEALIYLSKSLKIKETIGDKELIASSLNNIGELYALKQKYDSSLICFNRALQLRREIDDTYGILLSLISLGNFYLDLQEYRRALEHFQKALIVNVKEFDDTNFYVNPHVKNSYFDFIIINILQEKAKTFYQYYSSKTHDIKDLQLCFETYELIIELLNKIRIGYEDEKSKLFILHNNQFFYEKALKIAIKLFIKTRENMYKEKAFLLAEQGKANLLLDIICENEAKIYADIPDSVLAIESVLKQKLLSLQKKIYDENSKPCPDPLLTDQLEVEVFNSKMNLENHCEFLEKNYPKYYRFKYEKKVYTIEEIQQLLTPEDILLEYLVYDSLLYTFIITKERNNIIEIPIDPNFYYNIEKLRNFLTNANIIRQSENEVKEYTGVAYYLYKALLWPMQQFFQQTNIIIIPDGQLAYIPFGALLSKPVDKGEINFKDFSFILKDYTINYGYSSKLYFKSLLEHKKPNNENILAFALTFKKQNYKYDISAIEKIRSRDDELSELTGTETEVKKILEIVDGDFFIDSLATETVFKEKAGKYGILHIATHGIIDNNNPMFSNLVFSKDINNTEDGNLYAYELFNMRLDASMVVLSACNTGYGKLQKGEGLMTLARGFLYAGTPSIVISLWSVCDESTAVIMESFYKHLQNGEKKDVALRKAKLEYISNTDELMTNPYFWAGFIHVGNDEPIMKRDNNFIWLIIPLIIISVWVFVRFVFASSRRALAKKFTKTSAKF